MIFKDKKEEILESTSLSHREEPIKKKEEKTSDQPKTSRTLHVTISNENEDIPIDIGSDDEEDDDE